MCAAAAVIPIERHLTDSVVQFGPGLLDQLRDRVLDGYAAAPHGGVEVGFVLLGRRQKNVLVVVQAREIPCAHLLGPRFALSPEEEKNFPVWLENLRADPELQGLTPFGWGCSHNRSEMKLLEREAAFHQRFFSLSHDIVLVAKPQSMQAVSFGVFSRDAEGVLDASSPTLVTRSAMLDSLWDNRAQTKEPERTEGENSQVNKENFVQHQAPEPSKNYFAPKKNRSTFLLWTSVGVSFAVLVALLCYGVAKHFAPAPGLPPSPASLSVTIHPQANNLVFTWKGSVPQAQSASVEILDGTAVSHYDVSSNFSSSGMLVFPHQSGNVQAKLTVQTPGGMLTRSAGFIDGRVSENQPVTYQAASDNAASRLETANRRLAALVSVLQSREEHRKK